MSKLSAIFFLLAGLLVSASAQTAEKTLVKSFNLQGHKSVVVDADIPMEVKTWSQKFLRLSLTVTIEPGHPATLSSLMRAGRYSFKGDFTDAGLLLQLPALNREVSISGKPLQERFSLVVYTPEKVQVEGGQQAITIGYAAPRSTSDKIE